MGCQPGKFLLEQRVRRCGARGPSGEQGCWRGDGGPDCLCVQALSVGIFPYVLKLLQSSARELRPLLVFIWAKILAVDSVSALKLLSLVLENQIKVGVCL